MLDYYEVLGVSPSASQAAVKTAYHTAILRLHPDKKAGQEGQADKIGEYAWSFDEVQKAWQVCS